MGELKYFWNLQRNTHKSNARTNIQTFIPFDALGIDGQTHEQMNDFIDENFKWCNGVKKKSYGKRICVDFSGTVMWVCTGEWERSRIRRVQRV